MSARDFLFKLFKDAGLPDYIVAAALGNAQAESNFDPTAFNDTEGGDGALGIFQWRGIRQKNLRDFAKGRGRSPMDLGVQGNFFLHEIKNDPYETKKWKKVLATDNPLSAFNAFRDHYERSGGQDKDQSGYARGRAFTTRIYRDYTDPNYHFSTPDDAAAEYAKYPDDPDPYAPPKGKASSFKTIRDPQLANFFGFNAPDQRENRRAALIGDNQPSAQYQSPSSLLSADPARGDSFPYVTGPDIPPVSGFTQYGKPVFNDPITGENYSERSETYQGENGLWYNRPTVGPDGQQVKFPSSFIREGHFSREKAESAARLRSDNIEISSTRLAPSPLNPFMAAGGAPEVQTSAEAPLAQQEATALLAPQPSPGGVDPSAPNIFDPLPSRIAPAPLGELSSPGFQEGYTLGGISASTAPEPAPGDEKDPWNWKLSFFEGLEAFGVGLGQMSHGTDVNIGGVRDRINRRKAGEAAAATNQQDADTARRRETRLANVPAERIIDIQAVANLALAAGDEDAAEAMLLDTSGKLATEYAGVAFSRDKPLNLQAIASAAAKDNKLTPDQVDLISKSPAAAQKYVDNLFKPEGAGPKAIDDPVEWASIVRTQAGEELDPEVAAAMRRLANTMELPGADTATVGDTFTKLMASVSQSAVDISGQKDLLKYGAGIDIAVVDAANDFNKNATKVERAEAVLAANELFKDRKDKDTLVAIAETQGLPAAQAVAKSRDVATETKEERDAIAALIRSPVFGPDYEYAAIIAETSGQAGLTEAIRMQEFKETAIKEGEDQAKEDDYVNFMANNGHADVAAMIRAGNSADAADLYMQKTKEPDLPTDIRTIQWLMKNDMNGKAEEMLIRLRTAQSGVPDPREVKIMEVVAATIAKTDDELAGLRELISKTKQAMQIVKHAETGTVKKLMQPFNKLLDSVGIPVDSNFIELEFLNSLGKGLIPLLRGTGGGAMSDKDSDNIEASFSTIGTSKMGNQAILQFILHSSEVRKVQINAERDNFINGGDLDTASIDKFTKERLAEANLPVSPFASLPVDDKGDEIDGASFPDYIMMLHNLGRLRDGAIIIKPGGGFVVFSADAMNREIQVRGGPLRGK